MKIGNRANKIFTVILNICFGLAVISSIIQFHQVQVLGKHIPILEHQFIKPKSENEKSNLDLIRETYRSDSQDQFMSLINPIPSDDPILSDFNQEIYSAQEHIMSEAGIDIFSFRAPPFTI
jgi:hypothetical protein